MEAVKVFRLPGAGATGIPSAVKVVHGIEMTGMRGPAGSGLYRGS